MDLHFLRAEGGWGLEVSWRDIRAEQAGGSDELNIPRRTLIFQSFWSLPPRCWACLWIQLLIFRFFFFSLSSSTLKTICSQFSANEMTEWGAYSQGTHLKNCLLSSFRFILKPFSGLAHHISFRDAPQMWVNVVVVSLLPSAAHSNNCNFLIHLFIVYFPKENFNLLGEFT